MKSQLGFVVGSKSDRLTARAPWGLKERPKERGPKKGDQRKGTIFIDGPSMNSLMVSINEFIDGNPLIFIDGAHQ